MNRGLDKHPQMSPGLEIQNDTYPGLAPGATLWSRSAAQSGCASGAAFISKALMAGRHRYF